MNYSYIIIDDDQESVLQTKTIADSFSELSYLSSAQTYHQGIQLILEHKPQLVFLEINPKDPMSDLSLSFINDLYRLVSLVPQIIITTLNKELAFDAFQYNIADYLLKPIVRPDLLKSISKLNKESLLLKESDCLPFSKQGLLQTVPLVICIKSYGDYKYINTCDIIYFKADNNSTDLYLNNGDVITSFKTLKHFETTLSFPFVRIHNSYIINSHHISRIHTGNSVCYVKNSAIKLPFSKSYKLNIDFIIQEFSRGNYLEI